MPKTPHGVELPQNFNQLGRAPRGALDVNNPQIREFLTAPDFAGRLRYLAQTDPQLFNEVSVDLLQHRRALLGDAKSLPGQYNGRSDQPYEALPFAPTESFRPDRAPGTKAHDVWRSSVERLDADLMSSSLKARMRANDPDSSDSTWNRTAPSAERATTAAQREPSLRESLTAAATVHQENSNGS